MSLWLRRETFRNVLTGCQSHQKFERVPAELPPVTQEIGDFSGVEEENPQGQAVNLSGSLEEAEDGGGISHASEVSSHGGEPQSRQSLSEEGSIRGWRAWGAGGGTFTRWPAPERKTRRERASLTFQNTGRWADQQHSMATLKGWHKRPFWEGKAQYLTKGLSILPISLAWLQVLPPCWGSVP